MDPLVKFAIEMRHLSAASNETIQIDFHRQRVINGNQHWHFHGSFHYYKKIFYTEFFILTFCFVVLSHLIQQFSSLLVLKCIYIS